MNLISTHGYICMIGFFPMYLAGGFGIGEKVVA
jgi:hypothetical protein